MSAYISTDLNMVKELDPQRHELALQMAEFLEKGGTIEVLQGPSFMPPPIRHDPPPKAKAKLAPKVVSDSPYMDKITQREIEREERVTAAAEARKKLTMQVAKLAETMSYAQVMERTGLSRRMLYVMANEHGFKYQPANYRASGNDNRGVIDEAYDTRTAERIKAFKEIGLSRTQAMGQCGVTFSTFNRILIKFAIDYPKRKAGPHPAFFAKQQ